jgi:hypothetical protein
MAKGKKGKGTIVTKHISTEQQHDVPPSAATATTTTTISAVNADVTMDAAKSVNTATTASSTSIQTAGSVSTDKTTTTTTTTTTSTEENLSSIQVPETLVPQESTVIVTDKTVAPLASTSSSSTSLSLLHRTIDTPRSKKLITKTKRRKGLTFLGKLSVYIGFPLTVGVSGLIFASIEHAQNPQSREIVVEKDFILPFLLALTLVIVLGIQSSNFSGRPEPLIKWPKVRKVKKIVYHNKKGEIIDPPQINGQQSKVNDTATSDTVNTDADSEKKDN